MILQGSTGMLSEPAGILINDVVVGNCPVMSPETGRRNPMIWSSP